VLSKRPSHKITCDDVDEERLNLACEDRDIYALDFCASFFDAFSIGIEGELRSFCERRSRRQVEWPVTVNVDYSLPPLAFLNASLSVLNLLPKGHLKRFLAQVFQYVKWAQRLATGRTACELLSSIDHRVICEYCLSQSDSIADAMTCARQIGLSLCDLLFESFTPLSCLAIEKPLVEELVMMYPLPMFFLGRPERAAKKSQVVARLLATKSSKARDDRVYAAVPAYLERLRSNQARTENDCDDFEDLLYHVDITRDYATIGLLCKALQAQFKRPLVDVFSVLAPLDEHDRLGLFEVTDRNRPSKEKVLSVQTDSALIRANPGLLLWLLKDRVLVRERPDVIARLCSIHLASFGRNSFIEKVRVCAKIQLFLGSDAHVLGDDLLSLDPEHLVKRIIRQRSLDLAISVCRAVQPIDCRNFVRDNLPNHVKYLKLLGRDDVEELVVEVLCLLNTASWEDRMKILARLKPYVTEGANSGIMHSIAMEFLRKEFGGSLRKMATIAHEHGLRSAAAALGKLGIKTSFPICPYFRFVRDSETQHLEPLTRAAVIANLSIDVNATLADFENSDAPITRVFIVSHNSRITKAFKNSMQTRVVQRVTFDITCDVNVLFAKAVDFGRVRELCDEYARADRYTHVFDFLVSAGQRGLWCLCTEICEWMAAHIDHFFHRFSHPQERAEFLQLVSSLLRSAVVLEKQSIPAAEIFPPQTLTKFTVADARSLVQPHRIQQAMPDSIFEHDTFNVLLGRGEFETAFWIADARKVDITRSFLGFAAKHRDLSSVILKVARHLTGPQLETVVQAVAPILGLSTSPAKVELFIKQLLLGIAEPVRAFRVLMWFGKYEEALAVVVYHEMPHCLPEIYLKSREVKIARLERKCRRLMLQHRIVWDDECGLGM
jgi:hypothetical protein